MNDFREMAIWNLMFTVRRKFRGPRQAKIMKKRVLTIAPRQLRGPGEKGTLLECTLEDKDAFTRVFAVKKVDYQLFCPIKL